MSSPSFLLLFLFLLSLSPLPSSATFRLDLHHRFSDTVRRWAESRSHQLPGGWPEKRSVDYYSALAAHDRGRLLLSDKLTFSDGNETVRINNLGFLHYGFVSLGTPNATFLVALDTGSDLFWVPCDCTSCAPTKSGTNGFNFDFSIYSPNMSSTSKVIPCSSSFCDSQETCSGASSRCRYSVDYVSADTSSSGILVEDILYLSTEDLNTKIVKAPIKFGCGQTQTGSFLASAAPNGLFGLGMEKISVPSTLASSGITSNSFSMCFGRDGIGRISFGDIGSLDQLETPFNIKQSYSTYNISINGIGVGNISTDASFSALVDSGTSFTTLADPAYTSITKNFNAQVRDKRYTATSDLPFAYCYHISSSETVIPDISLITKGGSRFPITDPIAIISDEQQSLSIYCLAVIKNDVLNIIGQNFFTGLRIVFDRERMILGWKKFNCYDVEDANNPLPVNPHKNSSAGPPSIGVGPDTYIPEATKEKGSNGTHASVLTPSAACGRLSLMSSFALSILLFFVLI